MAEPPRGAILQRDKETYAIVPRLPLGILTPEILEKLAAVSKKYEIPVAKITSAQRIALVGIKPGDVEKVWEELEMEVGPATGACVHYVQACPGTTFCKFGQGDSIALGTKLEKLYIGKELPAKTKIAISGCKLNCAESYLRDIGAFASKKGWTLIAGGNSGGRPRIGDVVAEELSEDDLVALIEKCFDFYIANAGKKERIPRMIQRIGIEEFKKAVLG